jgi:hypothetical protein
MSLIAYCDIKISNPDTPIQLAGCGILLVHHDDDLNESNARTFKYGLSSNNIYCASLITMRLALSSIKPAFRKNPVALCVSKPIYDAYCLPAREDQNNGIDQGWTKKCYDEMKRWMSYYDDLTVWNGLQYGGGEHSELLSELAKQGCESQKQGDSGTIYWE